MFFVFLRGLRALRGEQTSGCFSFFFMIFEFFMVHIAFGNKIAHNPYEPFLQFHFIWPVKARMYIPYGLQSFVFGGSPVRSYIDPQPHPPPLFRMPAELPDDRSPAPVNRSEPHGVGRPSHRKDDAGRRGSAI